MNNRVKSYKYFVASIILIYALLLSVGFLEKANPYFWYDEAGQFWMSKGLNHDSPALQPEKGIRSVIENNAHYNMDPGGFSVLLHYWSKAGNSYIWLRLLPFLFYVLTVIGIIYLSYHWTRNIFIAFLVGSIPLALPILFNIGLELRAYSMEVLGTVTGIILLERLKARLTIKRLFITGLIFSFFITSRYSELIVVFIFSLYVSHTIFMAPLSMKEKLMGLFAYALPLLIVFAGIYFFSFSIQNPNAAPLFYLPYLKTDPGLLVKPLNLLYLLCVLFAFGCWLMRNKVAVIKKYESLLLLCVIVNVVFILLSFADMHPWNPFSIRCISMFLLTLLCFAVLAGELLTVVFKRPSLLKYALCTCLLLSGLYTRKHTFLMQEIPDNIYSEFNLVDIGKYNRIYVDGMEAPSVRYLFEYGRLKPLSKGLYPDRFTFSTSRELNFHKSPAVAEQVYTGSLIPDQLMATDLLIASGSAGNEQNNPWKVIKGTRFFFVKNDTVSSVP